MRRGPSVVVRLVAGSVGVGYFMTGRHRRGFEVIMSDAEALDAASIPVEQIEGPVLFVSAVHDEVWPSAEMSDAMMQRLDRRGFHHVHEHLAVEGGHESFPPAFPRVVAFLDQHLDCPPR